MRTFLLLPLVALVATHADLLRVQQKDEQQKQKALAAAEKSPTAVVVTGCVIGALCLTGTLGGMANAQYQKSEYKKGMKVVIKELDNPIPAVGQDADLKTIAETKEGDDVNHAKVLSEVLKRTNLAICE